jgi:selenide,water dikinase
VTTTALKREQAEEADVSEVVLWMSRLNRTASELAVEFNLRGGTDITGYSLLGHGMEMADASGVSLQIEYDKVPFVSCARKYAERGAFAGGAFDNRGYYRAKVRLSRDLDEPAEMLLYDPQTGLLLGVPQEKLSAFLQRAEEINQPIWVIGKAGRGKGVTVK